MQIEDKLALIEAFERLAHAFDDTLGLDAAALLFRPFEDAWSIIEQVVHCVDFDVANFHRYRWGIVSPGTRVLSFDGTWTAALNYQAADLAAALDTIKAVRGFMGAHLRQIVAADWSRYRFSFGEGEAFDLEAALKHFNGHVGFHRELIDRNMDLFHQR